MKRWLSLANRLDSLNKAAALVARIAVLLMLALGLWNVLGRYLGVAIGHNLSSNALIEGQWYLFDLIFLLGFGWTLQRQGHVRVVVVIHIRQQVRPKAMAVWAHRCGGCDGS